MKSIVHPLLGALLLISTPAAAAQASAPSTDAAKLAEAHAIIDVMFPPNQRDSMYEKLQSDLLAQFMPTRASWMQEPGIKKILDDFVAEMAAKQRVIMKKHLPEQIDAMARAYARRFSLAELKDIHAFAQTPSGRHYLSESLALIGDPDVAKVNSAAVAEIRAETDKMAPELKDRLIAYIEAHPEIADKIKQESKSQ